MTSLQAVIFSKNQWTLEDAKEFMEKHNFDYKKNYMPSTYNPIRETSKTYRFTIGCPNRFFLYNKRKSGGITWVRGELFGKYRSY